MKWYWLVLIIIGSIMFLYWLGNIDFDSKQDNSKLTVNCIDSMKCIDNCLKHYSGDDINHTLECKYKCMYYKYCQGE